MRGAHRSQCLRRSLAHLVGHRAVPQDAVRVEERGHDRRIPGDPPFAVTADEVLVQRGRDDAELRAEVEDVPPVLPEDPDRGIAIRPGERALVVCQQPHEHGLPRPVGADNRRVLPLANRQCQPVQHGAIVLDDRRVVQFEYGFAHVPLFYATATASPYCPSAGFAEYFSFPKP